MLKNNICKICGYQNDVPLRNKNYPLFEICLCCGAESGCDDSMDLDIKNYRTKWLKNGLIWFEPKCKPTNWKFHKQLENVNCIK